MVGGGGGLHFCSSTGENLPENGFANAQTGWAWGGVVLWIILLVAIIWLIAAFVWGSGR